MNYVFFNRSNCMVRKHLFVYIAECDGPSLPCLLRSGIPPALILTPKYNCHHSAGVPYASKFQIKVSPPLIDLIRVQDCIKVSFRDHKHNVKLLLNRVAVLKIYSHNNGTNSALAKHDGISTCRHGVLA